jgi:hypothetical protein
VGDDFSQDVAGEDAHPEGWLTHCESSMRAACREMIGLEPDRAGHPRPASLYLRYGLCSERMPIRLANGDQGLPVRGNPRKEEQ